MKKSHVYLLPITLLLFSYVVSENFIAQKSNVTKNMQKISISQLKQNIMEQLADLVKIEAQVAEINAKIQSHLFNGIEILTENNRKSWFNQLKQEELEQYNNKLKIEYFESTTRLKQADKFLTYINSTNKKNKTN